MIRTVTITHTLTQMHPDDRTAWTHWLTQHGLDPDRMPIEQVLVCNDDQRTITFDELDLDDDGKAKIDPDSDGYELARIRRTIQLEAPALPTPQDRRP